MLILCACVSIICLFCCVRVCDCVYYCWFALFCVLLCVVVLFCVFLCVLSVLCVALCVVVCVFCVCFDVGLFFFPPFIGVRCSCACSSFRYVFCVRGCVCDLLCVYCFLACAISSYVLNCVRVCFVFI